MTNTQIQGEIRRLVSIALIVSFVVLTGVTLGAQNDNFFPYWGKKLSF